MPKSLEEEMDRVGGVWAKLAAPLDPKDIAWRQDGKPSARDGRHFARFVCYVEAGTVRERLDSVVPGEWDLTLEPLRECTDSDGAPIQAFKAKLQVLGVIREDVGQGSDYKQAATDAFKRAAVRFGIGHELYAMEQNWVEVDGDGKYAKPVEDPQQAYDRRYSGVKSSAHAFVPASQMKPTPRNIGSTPADVAQTMTSDAASCPKCGGRMWDNRPTKRNPKAPDFKCRDRNCDGVVWPPKPSEGVRGNAMDADDYAPPPDETQAYDPESELPF